MEKLRAISQYYVRQILAPVVRLLARSRLSPNQISIAGFVLALIAMGILMAGYPVAAGILFLLGSSLDILDGALARLEKKITPFGAFLDSTLDRISEGAMLMAIAYRLALEGQAAAVAGVVLALLGGMLTSYTRARAEALGITCAIGWVSRPERVIIMGIGLIFDLLIEAIYLLAVLSLWTAGQRFFHISSNLRSKPID
ncbi:CDP-alcohol phosphatidyltransferase family protein [Nitrosococcus wardiae]|uniref:CDP-alcohol phosphatidyltransferase family protein n=1 Tax=Nitrosococcus wardiae TaxID=1814290 RepID=A0A4P7BYA2_9GAMM|nr:CDP-alcohol phosphatidyltransferase family protein [Nitrosococcus wardiae]QBQ54154.1 CDP-alcohol phosphatidyltransferase family protein [Nitrosococcus wardiae]